MMRKSRVIQEYAGRQVKRGELFDVEDEHINLLLVLGRIEAELPEEPVVAPSGHDYNDTAIRPSQYEVRAMTNKRGRKSAR